MTPIAKDAGWVPAADAALLSEILDKCLNAVLVHWDGRLLYANAAYARMHGYSSVEEAMAQHRVGISNVHPDDRAMIAELVAARSRGEVDTSRYEFRLLGRNGSITWVECLANRITWHGCPALLGVYHDVTARKTAEDALQRSERLFSTVFKSSPDGMVLSRLEDGRLLDANDMFLRFRGLRRDEAIGRSSLELGLWKRPEARAELVEELRASGRVRDMVHQVTLADGETLELSTSAELLRVNGENLVLYVSRDITDRRRSEAHIAHLARHDGLTGLANRLHFIEQLETALAGSRERNSRLAVLALDLDRFKEVNDTLGHGAGDALLLGVAERLRVAIRKEDVAGRLGGDEFAVMQAGVAQPAGSLSLAARLVEAIPAPYETSSGAVQCGASVGIALFPEDGETPEQLLRSADMALYQAKCGGRGAFRRFSPEMEEALRARRALEHDLRTAVREGGFEIYYQPLFRVPEREVHGFEALLRWHHPVRGWVAPSAFIPVAEESGMIHEMGGWVLRQACGEAAGWPEEMMLCVNLSPAQFHRGDLAGQVSVVLDDAGLPAHRLQLEITESVLLERSERVLRTLHALKARGVGITMDDFGTGYSSLGSVWHFPFDTIKIDRSFVRDVAFDPKAGAIVETILNLGRTLGVTVTAEGVETEQQMRMLLELGCRCVQGYLLGVPEPGDRLGRYFGWEPAEASAA